MTSLDFLYIALGAGFLIVSIFLSALLLNLILTLRDVNKITGNVRSITDKLKESVFEPLKVLSELTAGFGVVHELIEKIRARYEETEEGDMPAPKKNAKDKKSDHGFSVKKLGR